MKHKHLLLAVLVTAVWGFNFPVTKLGLAEINPLLLTALRFTLAALPWVFLVKRPQVAVKWLAAYGLIFGVAMWALINLGIAMGVPPGSASLRAVSDLSCASGAELICRKVSASAAVR